MPVKLFRYAVCLADAVRQHIPSHISAQAVDPGVQDPSRHAAAEQAILAFRNSKNAIQECIHILQCSSCYAARFHAALTLRQSAMDGWLRMTGHEQTTLRSWLLEHTLQLGTVKSGDPGYRALLKTLTALHALLLKRQWMALAGDSRTAAVQVLHSSIPCFCAMAGCDRRSPLPEYQASQPPCTVCCNADTTAELEHSVQTRVWLLCIKAAIGASLPP